ncbi:adenosylcobinamide-phosphate synthase CbiB [Halopenitus sp. H-Gu1]|uniref:adenosylcobinamide-phosphate synthase CbiB n=1 Tax=Halopenitus sp. H-Gu1 TaxID=3242697 RepID=UPI00359DECCF
MAAVLDRAFAEPPRHLHPVAWLGDIVDHLDRRVPDSRRTGVAIAALVPLGFGGLAFAIVFAAGTFSTAFAITIAALVLFSCSSRRLLGSTARRVVERSETNLGDARRDLRALAGRDASDLSPGEVRSAAVESAAENLADGLIAPLLGFVVAATIVSAADRPDLALPLAAGAAAWIKGVNTLDSMIGYPTRPIGWAAARLDDAVMWAPARVSAALLAFAAGRPAALRTAHRFARIPASPNSGWPMATIAAVIGSRLEKPDVYTLNADATLPDGSRAEAGIRIVDRAGWIGIAIAVIVPLVVGLSTSGSTPIVGVFVVV